MKIILFFSLVLLTAACEALQVEDGAVPYQARDVQVSLRAVAQDLEFPWDMAFVNDKEFLVTEKPGRLSRINLSSGVSTLIQGLPEVAYKGQGGLLGVALHPLFAENGFVYLSYAIALDEGTYTTRLLRARLLNGQLVEQQVLFTAQPALKTKKHFGGALVFDDQGYLYLSVGDRGRRLALEGAFVVDEELLFDHLNMRIRGVENGPDGALYVLSESGIIFAVEATNTSPASTISQVSTPR